MTRKITRTAAAKTTPRTTRTAGRARKPLVSLPAEMDIRGQSADIRPEGIRMVARRLPGDRHSSREEALAWREELLALSRHESELLPAYGLGENAFIYVIDGDYQPMAIDLEQIPAEGDPSCLSPEEVKLQALAALAAANARAAGEDGPASADTAAGMAEDAPAWTVQDGDDGGEAVGPAPDSDDGGEAVEPRPDSDDGGEAVETLPDSDDGGEAVETLPDSDDDREADGSPAAADGPETGPEESGEPAAETDSPVNGRQLPPVTIVPDRAEQDAKDKESTGADMDYEASMTDIDSLERAEQAGSGGSFSSFIAQLKTHQTPQPQQARIISTPASREAAVEEAEEMAEESVPAETPVLPDQALSEREPADMDDLDEGKIEALVSENVSREESRASLEGDITPFSSYFQYGDGRIECCVFGDAAGATTFQTADSEHANRFFRSCRNVLLEDCTHTKLPARGYWIPNHPEPKPSIYAQQYAQAVQPKFMADQLPDEAGEPEGAGQALQAPVQAAPQVQVQPSPQPQPQPEPPVRTETAAVRPEPWTGPRILMCWVGKVDVSAAMRHDTINPGPIRMLLEHVPPFDHVLLLTAMSHGVLETLRTWLAPCVAGEQLEILRTQAADLSDHNVVWNTACEVVESLRERFQLPADGSGITFHLSPGSPVTHAVLLLLATIRYTGITLMQTRLTGIGKDPDILTVNLPETVRNSGLALLPDIPARSGEEGVLQAQEEPERPVQAPVQAPVRIVAPARKVPLLPKPKGPLRGSALLQRFKPLHRPQAAVQAREPQPQPQPQIQTVIQESLIPEFDMPTAIQEENSLRTPPASIGKPSRISPTALQPREGDPPSISAALGAVYRKMQRVATMLLPILLLGESGCGKSRLAHYLHEWSGRSGKFISLDCAGLTDEMFACELFGRGGGGGLRPREGAFRKARSGTLFLENVNLLTPTQQSLLLRVLAPVGETKVFLPASSPFPACTVRVRIIASATPDLLTDISAGRFRTDLYYRLAGVSTTLPSVREYSYTERENLLRSFLVNLQHKLGQCWNFSGDAWQTLLDEPWPGNLREVSRILQQICLLSDSETTITREDVLQQLRQGRFANAALQHNPGSPAAENGYAMPGPYPVVQAQPRPANSNIVVVGKNDEDEDEDMMPYEDEEEEGESYGRKPGVDAIFTLGSGKSIDEALNEVRLAKIREAMEQTNGNRAEAAKLLGLSYMQLNYTLRHMQKNS